MPSSAQSQHARSHVLLLLQKLLNLRDSASPLTLVLDSLEQSAKPVVREFMSRAKVSKSKVIFVSFATLRKPADVDIFVRARGKAPDALRAEITSHYPTGQAGHAHKILLILDTLNPLCSSSPFASTLPFFLSSLIPSPAISLVAVYHLDVPLPLPLPPHSHDEYAPPPLATLSHLATAILRTSGLAPAAARRRARDRSQQEPGWGLGEGREGVLLGLRGDAAEAGGRTRGGSGSGLVLEMELRRRSGRAVVEKFVLVPPPPISPSPQVSSHSGGAGGLKKMIASTSRICLLSEHPAFRDPGAGSSIGEGDGGEEPETTFSLGLTEKQRRDREGIVLPYFDAQEDVGGGQGGRILYEMGREDDFDDEEDEI